jgi:hypothetical protein
MSRAGDPRAPGGPVTAGGEGVVIPLRVVVESEARRLLADARITPDPARIAEGWERRFVVDEGRVAEMVQLYHELGYETAVDAIAPGELDEDCGGCRLVAERRLRIIYTRAARASRAD